MNGGRLFRWAGVAAMVGGALWVVSTAMHASRPVGCVGEECASRAMRQSSVLEGILTLTAFLLFVVAAVGLIMLVRRAGRFGPLGKAGAVLATAGVLVLLIASLVQALMFDGDFLQMPYFVIPGIAALVIGVVLLAVTVLVAGVLPRWAAASLLLGTVALAGSNEQTAAAWLAIPFGLAWIAVGYALWAPAVRRGPPTTARSAATREPHNGR